MVWEEVKEIAEEYDETIHSNLRAKIRNRIIFSTLDFSNDYVSSLNFVFIKTSGITKNPQEAKKRTRAQSSGSNVTV
jgi:hypothetical protein